MVARSSLRTTIKKSVNRYHLCESNIGSLNNKWILAHSISTAKECQHSGFNFPTNAIVTLKTLICLAVKIEVMENDVSHQLGLMT